MFFDMHGYIAMEQNAPSDPGRYGDSCAETCRAELLLCMNDHEVIKGFITDKGYVRHPDSPWREDDFSGDQALPLYLYFVQFGMDFERIQFEQRLRENGWKLGNGDFVSFQLMSVMLRANDKQSAVSDLVLLGEILILRWLPWRWSDAEKKLENATNHSADWLNYYHSLAYSITVRPTWVSKLAAWLTPVGLLVTKVKDYYKPEPNSEWLVDLYETVAKRVLQ
jgi:hypothetical protein